MLFFFKLTGALLYSSAKPWGWHLVVFGHRFCHHTQVNYQILKILGGADSFWEFAPDRRDWQQAKGFLYLWDRLEQVDLYQFLTSACWVLLSWDLQWHLTLLTAQTRWLGSRQVVWLCHPCGSLDGTWVRALCGGFTLLSFHMWLSLLWSDHRLGLMKPFISCLTTAEMRIRRDIKAKYLK